MNYFNRCHFKMYIKNERKELKLMAGPVVVVGVVVAAIVAIAAVLKNRKK